MLNEAVLLLTWVFTISISEDQFKFKMTLSDPGLDGSKGQNCQRMEFNRNNVIYSVSLRQIYNIR
jgi:hypothetical protein